MRLSGDPYADFDRWDAEQERRLARLPKCTVCGEPIHQEDAVCIDGKYYCDDCLDEMRVTIGEVD